jgi:hypothetical protein
VTTAPRIFIGGFIFLCIVSAMVAGLLALLGFGFLGVFLGSMTTSTVFLTINVLKLRNEL